MENEKEETFIQFCIDYAESRDCSRDRIYNLLTECRLGIISSYLLQGNPAFTMHSWESIVDEIMLRYRRPQQKSA
jgi:hypothetical protein